MSRVPQGYKLMVVDKDGNVKGEINIGGYDLTKKLAQQDLMQDVWELVLQPKHP